MYLGGYYVRAVLCLITNCLNLDGHRGVFLEARVSLFSSLAQRPLRGSILFRKVRKSHRGGRVLPPLIVISQIKALKLKVKGSALLLTKLKVRFLVSVFLMLWLLRLKKG